MSDRSIRITDPLKEEVDKHEQHLQEVSHNLSHAHKHFIALSDLATRLRVHLEVKKAKKEQEDCSLQDPEQEELDKVTETGGKDLFFKFPVGSSSDDREFLKMVESLVEGIILIGSETNLGKMARDLQGSVIQGDLQKWQKVISILQKYDDQVRRAIDFFEHQHSN